jgi:hypothetical protein
VGLEVCATIARKPDIKHINVPRKLVMETVKITEITAMADSKESARIAVGKATKLTIAGRKKRTKRRDRSGTKKRKQPKLEQLLLIRARA